MIVSNRLSGIRYKIQQTQFLVYTYIIFLAGFYISPNNHLHRNFYYLFVLLPFLISIDLKNLLNCARSTLFKLSFIFLSYFLISMSWTDTPVSGEEVYDIIRYFFMLMCFILVTLSISVTSNQFFNKIKFWLCLIGPVSAIISIMVFYAAYNFPNARVAGPFDYTANPNSAAMFFGFIGILAFNSALLAKSGRHKIFYWCSFLVLFIYILLTQSRGPMFAFIVCLILGFAFEKRWKEIGIIIAFSIGFLCLIEFGDTGILSFFDRGIGIRKDLWLETLKRISQAPLLGEGYFTDVNTRIREVAWSPHNLFLLVILKSGVIGGGLLGILFLAAFKHSYEYFTVSANWIYICLLVFFFICMSVDSVHLLYKPSLGWVIFWLPISLIAAEEVRRTQL